MTLPVALLWLNCLAFLGFGLGFAAMPGTLAEFLLGVAPSAPNALIDMRATYGGLSFGAGLFFGYCAVRPSLVRLGLVASLLVVASLGVGRALGIAIEGEANAFILGSLATEIVFVGLCLAVLRSRTTELVATRPSP